MIHVRFQPSPTSPVVDVQIDETKHSVQAVLTRAMERVFPGPFDPMEEAGSEARFQAVMQARKSLVRRETSRRKD